MTNSGMVQEHHNAATVGRGDVEGASFATQRLVSLDAYRGFVMLALVAGSMVVEHALHVAAKATGSPAWEWIQGLWTHAGWEGAYPWDMVQPAFMFIVGVAVPYSYAKRQAMGESFARMLGHAVYRAIVLILLGVVLRSFHNKQTYWTFEDVVSQIGLGYVFLFLLWNRPRCVQGSVAAGLLLGYCAAWRYWPLIVGMPETPGVVEAGWHRSGSPAQAFDVWLRNLLPHEKPFVNWPYYTLNFIPSLANMIFGLMAGELLQASRPPRSKVWILCVAGTLLSLAGLGLDWAGVCPMIKKIWTPSFALYSGGWCLVFLGLFYYVVDVLGLRRWTFAAVVLGANSIAVYIALETWGWPMSGALHRHFTWWVPAPWGDLAAVLRNLAAALLFWWIFYWMYRRKIFLRI